MSLGFGNFTRPALLFEAIKRSNLEKVKELLAEKENGQTIDINAKDEYGYTPLHAACCIFSERDDQILTAILQHEGFM